MAEKPFRVKGIYGGPLAKKGGFRGSPSNTILSKLGDKCIEFIKQEATKVAGRSRSIPRSEKFFNSFSWSLRGKSTIEIQSSWPHMKPETYMEGKKGWRVGSPGKVIPLIDKASGKLIFRTMPAKLKKGACSDNVWCHPGLAKHTFIQRGIQRAKAAILDEYGATMVGHALGKKQ